jgi:hypothetical protein
LGFRVQGSGFRVQGSGFRVQDSGCEQKCDLDALLAQRVERVRVEEGLGQFDAGGVQLVLGANEPARVCAYLSDF